ncbi:LysM peptidoglycan-binding domain-containing protein [Methylorubrum sp. Q1]|uniref:LysM peptidoglycan-binding domain-containing protein n=1 Tax=Methylorubrum sp. Q1 TaxID=2562453 RepID=UPI00107683D4|nr:LysM peptidoglycan-binding domain-containing protein [Methylorubrum sp. Q1]TFZ58599.1 LysM peptidoglycan-binding domain-containing protein [Methylorubrum sp. Q1]
MTAEVRRSIVLAIAGLLGGFAMVVALFGTGELLKRNAAVNPSAETPATPDKPSAGTQIGDRAGKAPSTDSSHAALGALSQEGIGQEGIGQREPTAADARPRADDGTPTFDIVRVEPDGASMIAGRAAPNSRIELLRDGQPFASAQADASGQFALTPPDLPPGSSDIALRATGADGKPLPGRESVTVVVAETRNTKPLIALTAPDAPTRVLSQPGAPDASGKAPATVAAETPGRAGPESRAAEGTREAGKAASEAGALRIVSVDAQEGGRLHVTGQTTAWSSLRLYLNDTMVASGQSGADGRVAFTIGRGVKPGAYRIRVDSVDSGGGKVKARAEVAFAYPDSVPPTRYADNSPAEKTAAAATGKPAATAPPAPKLKSGEVGAAPSPTAPPPKASSAAGTGPERPAASGTASLAASAPTPGADGKAAALSPRRPDGTEGGSVFVPEVATARITRGDSLWQISRRIYGRGNRYTVIYDANQDQIRDPNRIYPGQMFVLPKNESTPSAPSARSGSDRRT